MLKKYLPFIVLIAAAGFYFFIKTHQRGKAPTVQTEQHITVPEVVPPADNPNGEEVIDRHASHIFYSKHARCRMACRHIDESEVKEILESGKINYSKVETDARGKTYPLEGVTHDRQHVRIVFAPKDDGVMVVTCIDLDTDWPCDCE